MIEFTVYPEDSGWEEAHIVINGDRYDFDISYIGDTFFELIRAAARLLGTPPYEVCSGLDTCAEGKVTKFSWDQEGPGLVNWTLKKPQTTAADFKLQLELELEDEHEQHFYEVDFREFCYALAKCFTEVLKNTGICGYDDALQLNVGGTKIDFKDFIYVKAFALNRSDEFMTSYVTDERGTDRAYSNFAKEIELIMQDM